MDAPLLLYEYSIIGQLPKDVVKSNQSSINYSPVGEACRYCFYKCVLAGFDSSLKQTVITVQGLKANHIRYPLPPELD